MSVEAAHAAEILALLAVPLRLQVFAELAGRGQQGATLSELAAALDLPVTKIGDACARLVGLGLATGTGNGLYRAQPDHLREAAAAVDRRQPISPLLDGYPQLRGNFAHGRLATMPPTLSDRYQLLGEMLSRHLALDGRYDEDTINCRLAEVTDDVAGVRRMLVETGWLERDRAGSLYGQGKIALG